MSPNFQFGLVRIRKTGLILCPSFLTPNDENKKTSIYKCSDKNEAINQGKTIAEFLNIGLLDSTDQENITWLIEQ